MGGVADAVSGVTDTFKKAVSTVTDPFDVGYGDMVGEAAGDVVTLGLTSENVQQGARKEGMQEQPTAPVPDDEASRRARERQYLRRYAGRGRAGTVLSEGNQLG